MSDIPCELFWEILLRSPAECVFRWRSVCKAWLGMIDDPCFIRAHTNNNNRIYSHTLLVTNKSNAPLYSFSLDSLNFINGPQTIDGNLIKHSFPLHLLPSPPHYAFCNGLILIFYSKICEVCAIWNPLTKEFRKLPRLKSKDRMLRGFGLGYDHVSDDYKVVGIFAGKYSWTTFIYSLKSDSWRMIEDSPNRLHDNGVFWNSSLYWLRYNTIIELDLGTESYSTPPLPIEPALYKMTLVRLESFDGCLFCSVDHFRRQVFEGWVMKDNGVEKSWIKLFSLQHFIYPVPGRLLMTVAYLKSKHQVVLQHDLGFLWFDIGSNSVKNFSIDDLPDIAFCQSYSGSLVRLKNRDTTAISVGAIMAERTRKRKRKIKIIDARLKFCVRDARERCCYI
ncbi:hypothetical protein OROMI_025372 [Orobanche minor]